MNRSSDLFPIVFMVCSLIGAMAIIVLKLLAVNQFFVTACPITIMLVYAGYYYSKQPSQLNIVGDNLYYLGFLYTLVSLAMSLFEFSPNDEAIRTITPIITNFGIAIFSTIFGIALRVFFNLMYKSPEEAAEGAVSNFSNEVNRVSKRVSSLDFELAKFSTFRIELEQILREASVRQKEVIEQFNTSVIHFTETVDEANKTFAAGREKSQTSLDSALEKMQASSEAVSASVSDLVGKINSLEVPEDLLEQLLQDPLQQIERGTLQIGEAGEKLANRLNNVRVPTDELEQRLQQASGAVSASVSDLVGKINSLEVPEDLLEQLLQDPLQQIERGTLQIGEAGEKLANRLNNVRVPTDELEQRLQQASGAVSASVSDLVGKINSLKVSEDLLEQLLQDPLQQIERGTLQIGEAGEKLANRLNNVKIPMDELEQRLQQTLQEVSASVSDIVEKINSMQGSPAPIRLRWLWRWMIIDSNNNVPTTQQIETRIDRTVGDTRTRE